MRKKHRLGAGLSTGKITLATDGVIAPGWTPGREYDSAYDSLLIRRRRAAALARFGNEGPEALRKYKTESSSENAGLKATPSKIYILLREAQTILPPHHRTTKCQVTPVYGKQVEVTENVLGSGSHPRHVMDCESPISCPLSASRLMQAKLAEFKALETQLVASHDRYFDGDPTVIALVQGIMIVQRSAQLTRPTVLYLNKFLQKVIFALVSPKWVIMSTFVMRHKRHQTLESLREKQAAAHKGLRSGDKAIRRSASIGEIGTITRVEDPHGLNGWHLHRHVASIVTKMPEPIPPDETKYPTLKAYNGAKKWYKHELARYDQLPDHMKLTRRQSKQYERDLNTDWLAQLKKVSATADRRYAVKVTADGGLLAYIGKLDKWTVGNELTSAHMKKSARGSVMPFGLLQISIDEGDSPAGQKARDLFVEHCEAMKGTHPVHWSNGLRAQFGIKEATDEELMKEQQAKERALAIIDPPLLKTIHHEHAWSDVLAVASALKTRDNYDQFAAYIAQRWPQHCNHVHRPRDEDDTGPPTDQDSPPDS